MICYAFSLSGLGFNNGSGTIHPMWRIASRLPLLILSILSFVGGSRAWAQEYPLARRGPQFGNYFGEKILDPYRWLEDVDSPKAAKWIAAERAFTQAAFAAMPEREPIRRRLRELWNTPRSGPAFETKEAFCKSNDGTQVSLILTTRKGLKLDGASPAWLHVHGDSGASLKPEFTANITAWIEMGGVFAQANVRGGGERGEEWRLSGTKERKQNAVDDVVAAANFLVAQEYTQKDRLVIDGSTSSAMLVAAATNQHPDLCAVALPDEGVLDMLRYQTFKGGAEWAPDFGTTDDPASVKYLVAESPVHNGAFGMRCPAILITTGDHDERVFPANSYKYAAAKQAAIRTTPYYGPVLIRIDTSAGPGGSSDTSPDSRLFETWADRMGFAAHYMPAGTLSLPKGP